MVFLVVAGSLLLGVGLLLLCCCCCVVVVVLWCLSILACLPACLNPACLLACLLVCLLVCLLACLAGWPAACLPAFLLDSLVWLFVCLFVVLVWILTDLLACLPPSSRTWILSCVCTCPVQPHVVACTCTYTCTRDGTPTRQSNSVDLCQNNQRLPQPPPTTRHARNAATTDIARLANLVLVSSGSVSYTRNCRPICLLLIFRSLLVACWGRLCGACKVARCDLRKLARRPTVDDCFCALTLNPHRRSHEVFEN